MLDVRGGQSESLDLAEFAVDRFRGYQSPQAVKGPVDALSSAPFSLVGVNTLFSHFYAVRNIVN